MRQKKKEARDFSPRPEREHAAVGVDPVVAAETDRLLSGRKRDLRLTGRLLDLYRRQSWHQRSSIVRSWMVWVAGVSLAMTFINTLLIPPEAFWFDALISSVVIPVLNAAVHLVWRARRSAAVEGLSIVLWMACLLGAFATMGWAAGSFHLERYLTGGTFIAAIGIVVLGIDLFWSAVAAATVVTLLFVIHLANPAMTFAPGLALALFYGLGIFATVIAKKTLIIVAQHSFLMTLRDRYRRAELAEANIRLGKLATTDALTGISNRRSASETIQGLWDDPAVDRSAIAFLMVDIDYFKRLNDSRGHAAGDDCIREVASTIAAAVRLKMDLVSRHGGEEFLIVLTKASPATALCIAERVRLAVAALAIPNPMSETAATVTVSLGVAMANAEATPEIVAKWADDALYEAKRQGRNRVCAFPASAPPKLPMLAAPSASTGFGMGFQGLATAG